MSIVEELRLLSDAHLAELCRGSVQVAQQSGPLSRLWHAVAVACAEERDRRAADVHAWLGELASGITVEPLGIVVDDVDESP